MRLPPEPDLPSSEPALMGRFFSTSRLDPDPFQWYLRASWLSVGSDYPSLIMISCSRKGRV